MTEPVDEIIQGVLEGMEVKHPRRVDSPSALYERHMRRTTRDYDVRDRLERGAKPPLILRKETADGGQS